MGEKKDTRLWSDWSERHKVSVAWCGASLVLLKWTSPSPIPMCLLPGCTCTCWTAHCWLWCSLWSTLGWWVTPSSLLSLDVAVFHFLRQIRSGGDVMLHYLTCLASCIFAPLGTHVALIRIAVRTDVVYLPCFAWMFPKEQQMRN